MTIACRESSSGKIARGRFSVLCQCPAVTGAGRKWGSTSEQNTEQLDRALHLPLWQAWKAKGTEDAFDARLLHLLQALHNHLRGKAYHSSYALQYATNYGHVHPLSRTFGLAHPRRSAASYDAQSRRFSKPHPTIIHLTSLATRYAVTLFRLETQSR